MWETFQRKAPALLLPVVVLLAQTAAPARTAAPSAQRKYVLAVGINSYLTSPLQGCVNDATDIFALLTGEFGFDSQASRILRDTEATRAGILAAIEQFVNLVRSGDLFVLFYSGHGTLFPDDLSEVQDETAVLDLSYLRTAQPGFELPNGHYDSALVPIDARTANSGKPWRGLILDDELFELFSRMTSKRVNVILISDSCHSGSLARSLAFGGTPKTIDPETALGVKMRNIALPARRERRAGRDMAGLYLALTSSRDDQLSIDGWYENRRQGLFTYAFIKAILTIPQRQRKRLTYAQIYEQYRVRVEQLSRQTQSPQIDRRYYNGELSASVFSFPAVAEASHSDATPLPVAQQLRLRIRVMGNDGMALAGSSFALFKPEVTRIPARITPADTLAILRTDGRGEAISQETTLQPGEYLIKVVCVGYKTFAERVRLSEDARQRGVVQLLIRLEPE